MSALELVSVLASGAVFFVALAWHTSQTQSLHSLRREFEALKLAASRSETTSLRVDLDALSAAVTKHAQSMRKQFGSVWGEFSRRDLEVDDAELAPHAAPQPAVPTCSCGWCEACKRRATAPTVNGADNG